MWAAGRPVERAITVTNDSATRPWRTSGSATVPWACPLPGLPASVMRVV